MTRVWQKRTGHHRREREKVHAEPYRHGAGDDNSKRHVTRFPCEAPGMCPSLSRVGRDTGSVWNLQVCLVQPRGR